MIFVNQIFSGDSSRIRILWVEKLRVIAINVDGNNAPFEINHDFLLDEINNGNFKLVDVREDEYIDIDKLPESYIKRRDELWEKFRPMLEQEPEIFSKKFRKQIINENLEEIGLSERYVSELMKRYWKSGKRTDSLIPMYHQCGKHKGLPDESSKKRGRPPKYKKSSGVNVDEYWLKVFSAAINKYYYSRARNSKIMTYELMRKDYFAKSENNGIGFPTFEQFAYWMNKQLNVKNEITSRYSSKKYLKEYRPLLSGTASDVAAPGIVEADSHKGDFYLVSSFSRQRIIGRPVLYILIDKFSRLVTGMYIGLEENSYVGLMMALYNTARAKQDFCLEYQVEISKEEWDVSCLPSVLIGDRAEAEGSRIENLISSLGVEVRLSASYRADMKGLVEGFFSLLNKNIKTLIIGKIDKSAQERGDRDYRLDATLTIAEYTRIVLKSILFYNNSFLDNYERTPEMIEDGVIPTPNNLWKWGLKNCGNQVKYADLEVQLALLPTDTALITRYGLKFRAMYYASKDLIKSGAFEKETGESKRLKLWYDPRNTSYIYVLNDENKIEKCELLPRSSRYLNRTEEEYLQLIEDEKKMKYEFMEENDLKRTKLVKDIAEVVEAAASSKVPMKISKKKAIENIIENRRTEKALLRKEEEFNNIHLKEID